MCEMASKPFVHKSLDTEYMHTSIISKANVNIVNEECEVFIISCVWLGQFSNILYSVFEK